MKKAQVYFTDLRTKPGNNLLQKFERLLQRAGIEQIDFERRITAIKMHFGEPGNLAFIRPNYAAALVAYLRRLGARPFLTDTCTLYSGRRANAPDHLCAARENGFTPGVTGCDVIIADGLKGTDSREVPVQHGEYCRTARIASAIVEADRLVSLNHFKGHELTGFGGALKNIGMGCASVGGKLDMHSTSQPKINEANCIGCGQCVRACAHDALSLNGARKAVIDDERCVGCGQCIAVCQYDAAQVVWEAATETTGCKIAEYTQAALQDKPAFHINMIMDVSPDCDCWGVNDYPLVPNIGMAASFDPVALDQASSDLVMAAPALPGSRINTKGTGCENHTGQDKFRMAHPDAQWQPALDHAAKLGLGTREYELISLD